MKTTALAIRLKKYGMLCDMITCYLLVLDYDNKLR
jgi:hypothetical protein